MTQPEVRARTGARPGPDRRRSLFADPLISGLYLSRPTIPAADLTGTLTGACAMPLFGRAIGRYGGRRMMAVIG